MVSFLFLAAFLLAATTNVVPPVASAADYGSKDRGEDIFRRALTLHRSKPRADPSRWTPWVEAASALRSLASSGPGGTALDAIGALEESILVIERAVVEGSEGEDRVRDAALATLYYNYAAALTDLGADDCKSLALSPHTLLIGAETAGAKDTPSTKLCVENAENSLRNAASLDATNKDAEKLLAELLGENAGEGGAHERKPKEFVAALFDDFAETFDTKLASLEYKVPGLVGEAARALLDGSSEREGQFRAALDAGCGTGLAGRHLRPLVSGPLIGVDASRKMLDIAQKCTVSSGCGLAADAGGAEEASDKEMLYDGLLELDLEDMTLDNTLRTEGVTRSTGILPSQAFDLIVAADVLVYFGNLTSLLTTFSQLSAFGAGLVFSCERAEPEEAPLGWRLLPSGRFAHTKDHAIEAAQKVGYRLRSYEEVVPRTEKGQDVRGHLFVFVLGGGSQEGEIKDEL